MFFFSMFQSRLLTPTQHWFRQCVERNPIQNTPSTKSQSQSPMQTNKNHPCFIDPVSATNHLFFLNLVSLCFTSCLWHEVERLLTTYLAYCRKPTKLKPRMFQFHERYMIDWQCASDNEVKWIGTHLNSQTTALNFYAAHILHDLSHNQHVFMFTNAI